MSTKKQILLGLLCMGAVVLVLGGIKGLKIFWAISAHADFSPPPESVTSLAAAHSDWRKTYAATGSITPVQGVTLSAEEPGKIVAIHFESGSSVKEGELLIEQDTSVEQADLLAAQADLAKAQKWLQRVSSLKSKSAMSAEELDQAQTGARVSQARVDALAARIARKKIVAPFSGMTGIRAVNVGQYVQAGTELVPLQALDRVYVNFSLPQQVVGQVQPGQPVRISIDSFLEKSFEGVVTTVNPEIDSVTRNVHLQATLDNPEGLLKPGMFADVVLEMPEIAQYITIPATSINYAPYGDMVYIIEPMKDPKGKEYTGVRQQIVQLGPRRGDQIAILNGLKGGEQIVTSGVFKLRPGASVVVNNSVAPGNSSGPRPQDT